MSAVTPETLGLPSTVVAKIVFEQDIADLLETLENDGTDLSTLTKSDVIEKVRDWAVNFFADDLYNLVSVFDAETNEDLIWGDES